MEHAEHFPAPFPWRAATVVAGGVALVELVALIAIGLLHLAPHASAASARPVQAHRVVSPPASPVRSVAALPSHPLRPRSRVRVLVLNGNGVAGAAATQAARLQGDGYVLAGATNAQRHDYARSMVMYVPGWAKEARRLAHETGIAMVAPVDGLRGAELRGAALILLLGR